MSTASQLEPQASHAPKIAGSGQYLTFLLAGEEYGLDILKVQEIRGWTQVTRIPHTPPHVQGVLNLRGTIVPIIDLRKRFDLEKVEYTRTTVVIVLSVTDWTGDVQGRTSAAGGGTPGAAKRVIGIVVDGVTGVLDVTPETVKPAPNFGSAVSTEFINGMASVGKRMVILLDSDRLLTEDELAALDTVH